VFEGGFYGAYHDPMVRRKGFIWVAGGMVLGAAIAVVAGVLVFWVFPQIQRARSPLVEARSGPVVVRCLKQSPLASEARALAKEVETTWRRVLEQLGIQEAEIPCSIYVYLYAEVAELPAGFSARAEEETTPVAVVDHLHTRPLAGPLARLACSLVFGPPGNSLFPRGLALYFDAPTRPWAAEAAAWGAQETWPTLWERAEQLLPFDPWEAFYFDVDAPWTAAIPTMEAFRRLLQVTGGGGGRAREWETTAGALAAWALDRFGRRGVEAFWHAATWPDVAQDLGWEAEALAADWEQHLSVALRESPQASYFLALRDLYWGKVEQALEVLGGVEGEEAEYALGLAHLALGEPERARELLAGAPEAAPLLPTLEGLAGRPVLTSGRLVLVGASQEEGSAWLSAAAAALERALAFWERDQAVLPDRITFYLVEDRPSITMPWGVMWIGTLKETPRAAVRFLLEAVSPLGLPTFRTLVEGVVLHLACPDREFRAEARRVLAEGRWVALSQPLFGVYPEELAEAEAGALVRYLVQHYGPAGVRAVWERLVEGASPFRAVEETLGQSLDQLERELKAWIKPMFGSLPAVVA